MIGFSHAAATDMPFASMLTIAMVFAAKLLNLIPPVAAQSLSPTTAGPFRSFISFTSLTSTSFSSVCFLGSPPLPKSRSLSSQAARFSLGLVHQALA